MTIAGCKHRPRTQRRLCQAEPKGQLGYGSCKAGSPQHRWRRRPNSIASNAPIEFARSSLPRVKPVSMTRHTAATRAIIYNSLQRELFHCIRGLGPVVMTGQVQKGKSGSGRSYGYDVVRQLDERGERIRGERAINQVEAEIIRRIFTLFALSSSPIAIARTLNEEGLPGLESQAWRDTQHGTG